MAKTKAGPKIKAEIVVNGVALQEYDDDDDRGGAGEVVKYVEAISKATFVIRYTFTERPKHDVLVDIKVDGKWVVGKLPRRESFHGGYLQGNVAGVSSNESGRWMLSEFSFSDLKTVDSEGQALGDQLMKDLKDMGQITIQFHYITNLRASAKTLSLPRNMKGLEHVPEKALKGRALSHQSALRDPVPGKAENTFSVDHVDPNKKPFASINFKYRSRKALQSLLIIPRSPSPVPLEERDVDTLSPEEMRNLLRRQHERDSAARAVKREGGVKRERTREQSSTFDGAEVDDDELSFVSAKRRCLPVTIDEDGTETIDLT